MTREQAVFSSYNAATASGEMKFWKVGIYGGELVKSGLSGVMNSSGRVSSIKNYFGPDSGSLSVSAFSSSGAAIIVLKCS